MESLVELPAQQPALLAGLSQRQHVGMALAPRGVGDLGHDAVQGLAVGLEAVVETDWVEAQPGIAQMGKQAHRPVRALAGGGLDPVLHRLLQRPAGRAEEIGAFETGQVAPAYRPQPTPGEHLLQLVQVQVELGHPVAEGMHARVVAVVMHHALVDRAVQHAAHAPCPAGPAGQSTPSALATSTALRMPSSWKPQPQ